MSNIKYKKQLYTGDEYLQFETAIEATLTEGKSYGVQFQGDVSNGIMLCEYATKPTEEGYLVNTIKPFKYTKETDPLWVKVNNRKSVKVNIAEA